MHKVDIVTEPQRELIHRHGTAKVEVLPSKGIFHYRHISIAFAN